MEKKDMYIDTVEEWYCTKVKRNVRVATAAADGVRRCLESRICREGNDCKNGYINTRLHHDGIISHSDG